jgi:hypothetical protein
MRVTTAIAAWASVALIALATTASAQAPQEGIYMSTDLGGAVLNGYYAESWVDGRGTLGNTINASSWDGKQKMLGTQWSISCPVLASPPILMEDTVDQYGDGTRIYLIIYFGGTIFLSGDGPWGGGATEYQGLLDTYEVTVTVVYEKNHDISASSTIRATGTFSQYAGECFELMAEKVVERGNTGREQKRPLTYPPFIESSCDIGPKDGAWGTIAAIQLTITGCSVPVEETSWGAVKSLYAD